MYKLLVFVVFTAFAFVFVHCQSVGELPYCSENNGSGLGSGTVIVSTLDGKISAINSTGDLAWQVETGPGPLLISNIHKLELTNNGEWIRIIPSLSGTLYKFDGATIDPIPITAESLLKSSFRYSDDLVIAGGIEVRTYGVGFRSGKIFYECTPVKCAKDIKGDADDVLLIERSTQTIRAVEPRTGHERWNFSVGLHNIKLPHVSCIDVNAKLFDWNISAVLPDGMLRASTTQNNIELHWQYKFKAPIVHVWRWNGRELTEINLFAPKNIPNLVVSTPQFLPAIYIGMHKKQLYIHESVVMQNILQGKSNTDLIVTESKSVAKIPWNPISASSKDTEEDSTALSILNASEYVNGNGYYLYTEADAKEKDTIVCSNNKSFESPVIEEPAPEMMDWKLLALNYYFSWIFMLIIAYITYIIFHTIFIRKQSPEIIFVERPVEVPYLPDVSPPLERRISERTDPDSDFKSRYTTDFDTIQCLGKGGFGVVFEVKQKIDECNYAIKRITLPNGKNSRERVMREVKALAKLDHQNIVRYFCSWVESPPFGWNTEHDQKWLTDIASPAETNTTQTTDKIRRGKSTSVSIDINLCSNENEPNFSDDDSSNFDNKNNDDDDDDSFIVFENPDKETTASSVATTTEIETPSVSMSEHAQKKINWRRPSRKHHSLDFSQISIKDVEPPHYLYIQMQLCQKESLKDWLNLNLKRDYNKSLDIFLQILNAVEYVHLQGLIHRDLKPSNIFFSLDGKIKVGDFGLVKDVEAALDFETKKYTPQSFRGHTVDVGTRLYMSPEQFTSRIYDFKVDIYSLGLIFFELLVPFNTAMERIHTLTNVKKQQFPKDFSEKFPNEYDLLKQMLCKNPKERLTTIGVKARPPYNIRDSSYDEKYYYNLPIQNQKT